MFPSRDLFGWLDLASQQAAALADQPEIVIGRQVLIGEKRAVADRRVVRTLENGRALVDFVEQGDRKGSNR